MCTKICLVTVSFMKMGAVKAILCVNEFLPIRPSIYCRSWMKFGVEGTHAMLLSVVESRENPGQGRPSFSNGCVLNYIHSCAVKPYDIF